MAGAAVRPALGRLKGNSLGGKGMGALETLSLAMGTAWTSGLNLYATIAALGIAGSNGWIHLPPGLEVLTNPLVIGVACLMYIVEFFVDNTS